MKHKISQTLYAYWNDVRNGRLAPRRFDIEPARIGAVLPDTFILERLEGGDYRFRLAGTRLTERLGEEIRGSSLFEGWSPGDSERLARLLADLSQKACVEVVTFEATAADGRVLELEMLLLPLVHTRGAIDRILGAISVLSDEESAMGVPLAGKKLIETETIWPDGKPRGVPETIDRQTPFHPHIRNARIVRQDRRQFRVYEGGLEKPGSENI